MIKLTALAVSFTIAAIASVHATELNRGTPTVVDGRTLELNGQRYVLNGIDAPDLAQTCTWGKKEIRCGLLSKTALMDLVAGAEVTCKSLGLTGSRPTVIGKCQAGGFDLGGNMVHTGWAVTAPGASDDYKRVQDKAKTAHRGFGAAVSSCRPTGATAPA